MLKDFALKEMNERNWKYSFSVFPNTLLKIHRYTVKIKPIQVRHWSILYYFIVLGEDTHKSVMHSYLTLQLDKNQCFYLTVEQSIINTFKYMLVPIIKMLNLEGTNIKVIWLALLSSTSTGIFVKYTQTTNVYSVCSKSLNACQKQRSWTSPGRHSLWQNYQEIYEW